jgi:hypothetical protein
MALESNPRTLRRPDMRARFSHSLLLAAAAALALAAVPAVSAAASAAQDPVPIGPNEYFTGLVNGHPPGAATVNVVCPGPESKTGHPEQKQPVEVVPMQPASTTDLGYTGSKGRAITASLGVAAAVIKLASFSGYYVPVYIPTKIVVPCSGTGTVRFTPAPTSKTAKTATLTVTFVNVAA